MAQKPLIDVDTHLADLPTWWWEAYEAATGISYSSILTTKEDNRNHIVAMRRLAKKHGEDTFKSVATAFLERKTGDQWVDEKPDRSVLFLAKMWGKCVQALAAKNGNNGAPFVEEELFDEWGYRVRRLPDGGIERIYEEEA